MWREWVFLILNISCLLNVRPCGSCQMNHLLAIKVAVDIDLSHLCSGVWWSGRRSETSFLMMTMMMMMRSPFNDETSLFREKKNAPFFMSLADTLFDGEILKLRVNIDNWFDSSLVLHGMSTIYVNDIMSYKGARISTFMLGTLQQAQISIHTNLHCSYLFLSVYLAYCFFLPSLKVVSAARDYLLPLRSAVTWLVTN